MYKALSGQTIKVVLIDFPIICRDSFIEKLSCFSVAFFNDTWEIKRPLRRISKAELDRATLMIVDFIIQLLRRLYTPLVRLSSKIKSGSLIRNKSQLIRSNQSIEEDYFTLTVAGDSDFDDLKYIVEGREGASHNLLRILGRSQLLLNQFNYLKTRIMICLFGYNEWIEFSSA